MTVAIEKVGRRFYAMGNTYAIKDVLKSKGFKWDPERRAWYTGKRELAESLNGTEVAENGGDNKSGDGNDQVVAGRAEYKGRTYYLAGRVNRGRTRYERDTVHSIETRDGGKLLLAFRDGSKTFWAARESIRIVKTYQSPQTIGGLQEYAERAKSGEARCAECGGFGELVQDLEDGMLKHHGCCDIPSN